MEGTVEIRCSLHDAAAEAAYLRFRDTVCDGKSRRYAVLCKNGDGIRCKLQNSGRCLDADTPWPMVLMVIEPMFRFDDTTEWVALLTVDQWKAQLDEAVTASLDGGRAWTEELSARLAAELPNRRRLIVTR